MSKNKKKIFANNASWTFDKNVAQKFDYHINKSIPIYGRILLENINTAIKLRKNRLILGRTANEYKSNFGAVPIRSFVYLKVRNKFMRALFRPIYSRLSINEWIQRNPFK